MKWGFRAIFFLAFSFIFLPLSAATIQDIKIHANSEALEIIFKLDSRFSNKVIKQDLDGFSTIILKDTRYAKPKVAAKTRLVREIEIFEQNRDVYVILGAENFALNFTLSVLNNEDSLKILITPTKSLATQLLSSSLENKTAQNLAPNPTATAQNAANPANPASPQNAANLANPKAAARPAAANPNPAANPQSPQTPPTAQDYAPESWRYVAVVAILSALVAALFIAKRRILRIKSSSLPYKNHPRISKIINLDLKNRIVVLDLGEYSYVLFVGAHGSFIIDRMSRESEFMRLLEDAQRAKLAQDSAQNSRKKEIAYKRHDD